VQAVANLAIALDNHINFEWMVTMDDTEYSIGDRVKLVSECYAGFERGILGRVTTSGCIAIVDWDNGKTSHVNKMDLVRVDDNKEQIKPPLGLCPKVEWMRERVRSILFAMNRYSDGNLDIPRAWAFELLDLTDEIESLA